MDINLNLYNMGLSTAAATDPLYPLPVGCTTLASTTECTPSILGFYLTFYNSNTATSTSLFADAFVGFVEFTTVAGSVTSSTTSDNILVALNQKTNPTATLPDKAPTLALTNYGNDWTASAFNTLTSSDS